MLSIATGPAGFDLAITTPPDSRLRQQQQQAMQPMMLRTTTIADAMMRILISSD